MNVEGAALDARWLSEKAGWNSRGAGEDEITAHDGDLLFVFR